MRTENMLLIERISKYMTYSGACTASACGAIQGTQPVIHHSASMTLSDVGIFVGILVGIAGLIIQGSCSIMRRLEEREAHKIDMGIKREALAKMVERRRIARDG